MSKPGVIPPQQQRSEETLSRIMQGALSLLAKQDLTEVTIEDIANASGVAVGTIYRRFSGREALVLELLRRIQINVLATLGHELAQKHWREKDLEVRLAWLVERQRHSAKRAPGLMRAIFTSVVDRRGSPDEESARLNSEAVAQFAAWLLDSGDMDGRGDADAAAIIVSNLLVGINLALLYPAAFAPHAADKAVEVLQAGALAALRAL